MAKNCDPWLRLYYDVAAWHLLRMGNDPKYSLGDHWVTARLWHCEVGQRVMLNDGLRVSHLLYPHKEASIIIGGILAADHIHKVLVAMGYVQTRSHGKEVRLVDQEMARPAWDLGTDEFFDDQKRAKRRSAAAKKGAATRKAQAELDEIGRQEAIKALDAMRNDQPQESNHEQSQT